MVIANVERKVALMEGMTKVRELPESIPSIDSSHCSVKISKLTREIQRLTGLVESKSLKLQTMPGLVDEASCLREKRSKAKQDKDRLPAENKIMLALGMEILNLNARTSSIVGSLQEEKARAVLTEKT